MSIYSIEPALLKKELRQFAPLIVGIVLLALIGFIMIESQPYSWRSTSISTGYLLLALPAFFAVGAGAISVSQEKESRTLGWLASLPLTRESLIRTKFVAAVLILVLLWFVTIGCVWLIDLAGLSRPFPGERIDTHPIYSSWLAYWTVHSFYLLVCSFLTAWWLGSSMTSLVAFLPIAFVPSLARFAIAYAQDPGHHLGSSRYDATLTQLFIAVTLSLVVAIWLMRKISYRALQPAESKLSHNPYSLTPPLDLTKQTSQSVLGPMTAMLWQFVVQNKTFLLSILAATGVSAIVIMLVLPSKSGYRNSSQVEPFAWFVISLCVSWMGVLVFQGDNLHERIRFLSDRGVKPFSVWITRLLMPLSFAASLSLFYALYRNRVESLNPEQTLAPVGAMFLFATIVIGYSHWFAQLLRNPILGAIGAPIISLMACVYLSYCFGFMGTTILPLVLLGITPFIATFVTMSRWMDRRFDFIFWASHGLLFMLAALMPLAELGWYVARFPNMPRKVQVALHEEAGSLGFLASDPSKNWFPAGYWLESFRNDDSSIGSDLTVEDRLRIATMADDSQLMLKRFQRWVAEGRATRGLIFDDLQALFTRVLGSRNAAIDAGNDRRVRVDYQANVELLYEITRTLRATRHLPSQENADLGEIALLRELMQPEAKQLIEASAYTRYVDFLSDSDTRNRARREALVVSWARLSTAGIEYGHFQWLPFLSREAPQAKAMLTYRRQVNHLAGVLMQLLEVGPSATEDQKASLLQSRITGPEHVSWSEWLLKSRIEDPRECIIHGNHNRVPGDQWFAGWEKVARDLKNVHE